MCLEGLNIVQTDAQTLGARVRLSQPLKESIRRRKPLLTGAAPDGREVAFQRSTGSDHRELWIVPADGGEPRLVVGGDVHYSHPQWNPTNADEILIVIDHLDLGIVRVGTGEVERITELASSTVLVDFPSWSADGSTIYFMFRRLRGDLYLIEQ